MPTKSLPRAKAGVGIHALAARTKASRGWRAFAHHDVLACAPRYSTQLFLAPPELTPVPVQWMGPASISTNSATASRRMRQHARMGIDIQPGFLPSIAHDVGKGVSGQRAPRSMTKTHGLSLPFRSARRSRTSSWSNVCRLSFEPLTQATWMVGL